MYIVRGSRQNTIWRDAFHICTSQSPTTKFAWRHTYRWMLCGQRGSSAPLPSGAGIDYEIAPDKANEIPPRRAWLVVSSCSRERVSLMPGLLVTFPIISAYRYALSLSLSLSLSHIGENTASSHTSLRGYAHPACSLHIKPCYTPHVIRSSYGEGWCKRASPLIAIRLYLVLSSKLQCALSCAPCHAAAPL